MVTGMVFPPLRCLPRLTGEVPPKGRRGKAARRTSLWLSPSGPAGHLPRMTGEECKLTRWRPLRRDGEGALLLERHHAFWPGRRPLAGLHRLGAARLAIAHVFVGPDMHPLVQRADIGEA